MPAASRGIAFTHPTRESNHLRGAGHRKIARPSSATANSQLFADGLPIDAARIVISAHVGCGGTGGGNHVHSQHQR
jgi:hypothetical protein